MKKTIRFDRNHVPKKSVEQILYTTPALAYIISMAKAYCGKSKKTKSHFIVIAQNIGPGLRKQGMKPSPPVEKFQYRDEQFKLVSSLKEISLKNL